MQTTTPPIAIIAEEAPPRAKRTVYPEPFASLMEGREKRTLGDLFGIKNFGVNLTRLEPGSQSALLHRHKTQDEFIFILEGEPTLITETHETQLRPGMCAGFTPQGEAHYLANRTSQPVVYLEVGDRSPGDEATYPQDDLVARFGTDGQWHFSHKNGDPY